MSSPAATNPTQSSTATCASTRTHRCPCCNTYTTNFDLCDECNTPQEGATNADHENQHQETVSALPDENERADSMAEGDPAPAGERGAAGTTDDQHLARIRERAGCGEKQRDGGLVLIPGELQVGNVTAIIGEPDAATERVCAMAAKVSRPIEITHEADPDYPDDYSETWVWTPKPIIVLTNSRERFSRMFAEHEGDSAHLRFISGLDTDDVRMYPEAFANGAKNGKAVLLVLNPPPTPRDEKPARQLMEALRRTWMAIVITLGVNARGKHLGHSLLTEMADTVIDLRERKRMSARAWLEMYLQDGPKPKAEVLRAAEEAGFGARSLEYAAAALGVIVERLAAVHGPAVWRLP